MPTRPPLIDLHRHLDGSVRLETILDLGRKHGIPLPADTLEGLRPHVVVTTPQPGLIEFLAKFKWMTAVLADYYSAVERAKKASRDVATLTWASSAARIYYLLRGFGMIPEAKTPVIPAVS